MKKTINFQKKLAGNNTREWFDSHKEAYQESENEFSKFIADLETRMMDHDHLDTSKTHRFRIYRDVRFSNVKTPYTKHRSVSFSRATESLRGGYYLRIEPGNKSMLAGGFWRPEPGDLLHIRKQLAQDPEILRGILSRGVIKSYFGELQGDKVKTAPKGFSKEDPAIDLLRHKGFILAHSFSDEDVIRDDFAQQASEGFRKLRPFFDYMSEILTTDLNGESLIQ